MFRREDWHPFIDPQNLPQKAGCHPNDLMKLVLKELVDNALDAGANVSITRGKNDECWIIADDGPGIDPAEVPDLFCVNRPLVSSKLKRLPTRGAVCASLSALLPRPAARW